MASQMDALKSFIYLADNLPSWMNKVEDLAAHTAKRHNEFASEYARLLKHAQPRKQKTPSMYSHCSDKTKSIERSTRATSGLESASHRDLDPLEAGNRYLFASARRKKRTTGNSVRSGASGPQKFRQRHAVVIYYDGHVQQSFEDLVKNISTARNNLRKGKKARMMDKGPMLPSYTTQQFGTNPEDFKRTMMMAKISVDPKTGNTPDLEDAFDDQKAFDNADKILEEAQNLCETAAHQFLRDGDSSIELEGTKEKLRRVLEMAKSSVSQLQAEEKEILKNSEDVETAPDLKNIEQSHDLSSSDVRDVVSKVLQASNGSGTIEVDDESGEDDDIHVIDLDIKRYRAMLRPSTGVRV